MADVLVLYEHKEREHPVGSVQPRLGTCSQMEQACLDDESSDKVEPNETTPGPSGKSPSQGAKIVSLDSRYDRVGFFPSTNNCKKCN